jgi:hypothetical protein
VEEGDGEGTREIHDADSDGNGKLELTEVLRVVQLHNAAVFHCDGNSEDGYALGGGDRSCRHHSADFGPADWSLSLPEVMRVVQLYNAGEYSRCENGEDGYCF